ncbi:MAG: reprolysin-like metallopeptidase [Phycisphaerales bacterium]
MAHGFVASDGDLSKEAGEIGSFEGGEQSGLIDARSMVFGASDLNPNHVRYGVPGTVRSRAAVVDVDGLLRVDLGDELVLNLFEDATHVGVIDRLDGRSFSGTIRDGGGSFVIVVNPEAIAGYVSIQDGDIYQISGTGMGDLQIDQVDRLSLPSCGLDDLAPIDLVDGEDAVATGPIDVDRLPVDGAGVEANAGGDGELVIDVMVIYTDDARADAGGTNQIRAEIDLSIAASNRAYNNSEIGFQINLVHTQEFEYDENTSSYSTYLTQLRVTNDGVLDEVHELRDLYGADIVTMLVEDGRNCGVARLMTSLSSSFQSSAFNIVTWYCGAGNLSFPHELGHNMGACHARGDGGGCNSGGLFSYSVGHRWFADSGTRYRSVMAYSPGRRIEQFSNPDVLFGGQPTGVPNDSNNALTLNQTSELISNFRAENDPCPADLVEDLSLNFLDLSFFLSAYSDGNSVADWNEDGLFNFLDLSAFLATFSAGCP